MTLLGAGAMECMATSRRRLVGQTWLFFIALMNKLVLLCWRQRLSTRMEVTWLNSQRFFCDCLVVLYTWFYIHHCPFTKVNRPISFIYTFPMEPNGTSDPPGRPGCRNVRAGGDNVRPSSMTSENGYFTYVVYKSCKYPPPVPKLDLLTHAGAWKQGYKAFLLEWFSLKDSTWSLALKKEEAYRI